MKNVLISLLIIICFFSSCKPDKDETPKPLSKPACWEKFVGTYTVYDTSNGTSYLMKINHFSVTNHNGGQDDTIVIENYANKFDFKYNFTCFQNENFFRVAPPFPSRDHNGKRWALFSNDDDVTTSKIENELKNDTIIMYYKMDNIAFYYYDSVPYFSDNIKQIAVKQH